MADQKITDLAPIAAVLPTTILVVVDAATGTNKKATVSQLGASISGGVPGAHHTTHETGGADAIASLSAGILTSGTLPDARLSANVQMKPVAQSDVTGLTAALAGKASSTHATTHSAAGSDPVTVTNLAGYPGGTATFLRSDGTFAAPPTGATAPHHATHEPGGSDPMAVDAIAATGSLRTLGSGAQQAAPGNDARFTNARTPTAHAPTHSAGGSDPITVTALAGYPGGTTNFLRADGTFATPAGGSGGAPSAHHTTHEPGGTDVIANVPWLNVSNTFTQNQTINRTTPGLFLWENDQAVDARQWEIYAEGAIFRVEPLTDAGSTINTGLQLTRAGVLFVAAGLGATPLNGSQVTSGTIADARLSANVALLNAANVFTADQTISKVFSALIWDDTGQAADARRFRVRNSGGQLSFAATSDAGAVQFTPLTLDRAGNVFAGNNLQANGNLTVNGLGTLTGGLSTSGATFQPTGTQRVAITTSGYCGLVFSFTGGPADNRRFDIENTTSLFFEARSDDGLTIQSRPITANRDGSVSIGGVLTVNGALTASGLIGSTAFGSHTLIGAGAGAQLLYIQNTNNGGSTYTALAVGNNTSASLFLIASFSSTWTAGQGADALANATVLRQGGAGGLNLSTTAAAPMRFYTTNLERLRIAANGSLLVGATAQSIGPMQAFIAADQAVNTVCLGLQNLNAGNGLYYLGFYNSANGTAGYVLQTGATTVSYSTTSDARLKIDRGRATDLTALRSLVIHDFTWIEDNVRDRGLFAQEAVDLFPRAITRGTDERTSNGALKQPWMADYSKFVPDLIAGWQQHDAEIATLITELTTLRTVLRQRMA